MKKFLVTRKGAENPVTNGRYAMTAADAAIIESKLYEADDMSFTVREIGSDEVVELRVVSKMSYVVTDVTPVPAAV